MRRSPPAVISLRDPFTEGIACSLIGVVTLAIGFVWPAPSRADESLPASPSIPAAPIVESFTRSIQPLLLNRCATSGCHVGPKAPQPRFLHRNARGHIDRDVTLANLRTVEGLTQDTRSFDKLLEELLTAHPGPTHEPPMSAPTATMLRKWLASKRSIEADPTAFQPTDAPNRFRIMLEAAANHAPLWPPPQEPRGIILRDDPPPEAD